jgi:hypothetical protein
MRVGGMALFPFILLKDAAYKHDAVFINHERIHLRQQLEMLILPFYILYLLNYLTNLLRYKNHNKAYLNIVFEREAYHNEHNLNYLKTRKFCTFLRYF